MLCLQTEDNWSLYLDPIIDFSLHNRNNFTLFVNILNRNKKNVSFQNREERKSVNVTSKFITSFDKFFENQVIVYKFT